MDISWIFTDSIKDQSNGHTGERFEDLLLNGIFKKPLYIQKIPQFYNYEKNANSNMIFLHSHQNGKY